MHVALLGDVPVASGGLKPLLQWQDAQRRRLQSFPGAQPSCWIYAIKGTVLSACLYIRRDAVGFSVCAAM